MNKMIKTAVMYSKFWAKRPEAFNKFTQWQTASKMKNSPHVSNYMVSSASQLGKIMKSKSVSVRDQIMAWHHKLSLPASAVQLGGNRSSVHILNPKEITKRDLGTHPREIRRLVKDLRDPQVHSAITRHELAEATAYAKNKHKSISMSYAPKRDNVIESLEGQLRAHTIPAATSELETISKLRKLPRANHWAEAILDTHNVKAIEMSPKSAKKITNIFKGSGEFELLRRAGIHRNTGVVPEGGRQYRKATTRIEKMIATTRGDSEKLFPTPNPALRGKQNPLKMSVAQRRAKYK